MKTFGIIVAMEKEITFLKEKVFSFSTKKIAEINFYEGKINNQKIVFATSGIGKVNAAVTAMLLIEHYHPDVIINTGIAGGYERFLKPFDIVLAKRVVYADVDMTCEAAGSLPRGQIEGFPPYFSPNIELITNNHYKIGTILTGDQFVYDYEKTSLLVNDFYPQYDVLAFDMESAAIAQVCTITKTKYLIMRIISDVIGTTSSLEYQAFSTKAAKMIMEEVLTIIENL